MKICRTPPWASYKITINPGVWIIFLACGCMCNCVRPSGKQCASGLSLLLLSLRSFRIAAAQGVNGRPPGTVEPISKNSLTPGGRGPRPTLPAGGGPGGGGADADLGAGVDAVPPAGAGVGTVPDPAITPAGAGRRLRFPSNSQIPSKSGWPSAVRGVGPSIFGLPSASFGTPGVG